ncbi:MAG: hypothetical protein LAT56_00275 [Wenzhouxiangella sp.]|nr:hypothetical protein [Wenzhouxiangella sp.]
MMYAKIDNGKVSSVHSGTVPNSKNAVALPDDHQVIPDTDVQMYGDRWHRRPMGELVQEGIIDTPEGLVWDDILGDFRPQDTVEPELTLEHIYRNKRIERLYFLRAKLSATDHKLFADYDPKPGEDVEVIKRQRHEWREEARQLIADGYDEEPTE